MNGDLWLWMPSHAVCLLAMQKNAVAVAYCKRGKGEIRLNGEPIH
jgi:hypothetical protein